jgi:hypothetical protein
MFNQQSTIINPLAEFHTRFQVSGVGLKGERSNNQELDPLEKTLVHKVAKHQRHRQVDKKSALFKNPSFSVPL